MRDIASVASALPPHRLFSPAVALVLDVIDDPARLSELTPDWEALTQATGEGALLRGPAWSILWFQHYGPALEARPHIVVGRAEGRVVGIAPFYERSVRIGPGVRAKEVRLFGD